MPPTRTSRNRATFLAIAVTLALAASLGAGAAPDGDPPAPDTTRVAVTWRGWALALEWGGGGPDVILSRRSTPGWSTR